MKKNKIVILLFCVACLGIIFTGCTSITQIKNENNELIIEKGAITRVGDYLFYANAYSSSVSDSTSISSANSLSNLKRVNLSTLTSEGANISPDAIDTIANYCVGFEKSYMFTLGQSIYFVAPQKMYLKDTSGKDIVSYNTSLFKVSVNGGTVKEIERYKGTLEGISVIKNGNNYYVLSNVSGVVDGESTVNKLYLLNLSNDKVNEIASEIASVAMPEDGIVIDYIYYTKTESIGATNNSTYIYSISEQKNIVEKLAQSNAVTFIKQTSDSVYYTTTSGLRSIKSTAKNYDNSTLEYSSNSVSISNLSYLTLSDSMSGILFVNNESLLFSTNNGITNILNVINSELNLELTTDDFLFASGTKIFFMTESKIYVCSLYNLVQSGKNIITAQIEKSNILTSGYGYDGENLYFYAQIDVSEEESESEDYVENTNYYLHMANLEGNIKIQLLGEV